MDFAINLKPRWRMAAVAASVVTCWCASAVIAAAQPDLPPSSDAPTQAQTASITATTPANFIYGYSVQHRPLVGYTFGTGVNKTLIMASIHGNERNTRPLAEKLIAYLKANPDSYAGCTVTVLPCLNPDGWARSTRVNARGVDLNRNFGVGWHANVPGKLSRGSGPLSEPESAALTRLVKRLRPAKIVSIHNPLHLIDATDGSHGVDLAKLIAGYDHYPVPSAGVGYPTPGSFGQFAAAQGCAVVTLELPRESVEDAWSQNKAALLAVIRSEINVPSASVSG